MIMIRPFEKADLDDVLKLEHTIYPSQTFTHEWWQWKYGGNSHGTPIILVAETSEQQIVGLRGFWPRQFDLNGTILTAFQAVDVGIHPNFRRRGIFTLITNKAIEIAKDQGTSGFFNFPHVNSMPGYLKIGWKCIRRLHWWVRPLPGMQFWKQHSSISFDKLSINAHQSPGTLSRFIRDEDYLKWRYENKPDIFYKIWELGTYHGQQLYAVTADLPRKGLLQTILVDIIGGGFTEADVSSILDIIISKSTRLGKLLTIMEGTLGYSTRNFWTRGFIRVPKYGLNYVIDDIGSNGLKIPFINMQICPGDMDTF